MKNIILTILACLLPLLSGAENKPNFIIILVDDMGYNNLGCYGSKNINTPHLDRMAKDGLKLTGFYATSPICTPTRASLITGRYPSRVGLGTPIHSQYRIGLDSKEVTIAEMLKTEGYKTGCVGKWHLGHYPEFYPTRHGFDYYYGTPLGHMFAPEAKHQKVKPSDLFLRNEQKIPFPKFADLTADLTQDAVHWIGENKNDPFFLFLSHPMPHIPLVASERFRGKSKGGLYGDVCEEIDWSVGQVLDALKTHAIEKNTCVIFTSDNGAESPGNNIPFRGKKQHPLEGGVRVPCIVKWPAHIPPGITSDELTTVMDFLPTFAALIDAPLPDDRVIDGKDIANILTGIPGAKSPYESFIYHARLGKRAGVRMGNWKLLVDCEAITWKHKGIALYDLENDRKETKNLAESKPEIVKELQHQMTLYEQSLAKEKK